VTYGGKEQTLTHKDTIVERHNFHPSDVIPLDINSEMYVVALQPKAKANQGWQG
jgi:hypothetical protein